MSFRERAERAAGAVNETLGVTLNEAQADKIARAIEKEIIEAVLDESQRCIKVSHDCCPADRDIAHKIADQIKREHTALIANLSSMR